jgi:trehalose synthase-fused probable maltokinase
MIFDTITNKRWFMGKGQAIRQISEMDSAEIAGVQLQILKVEFENGTCDLYATMNDESKAGALLAEGFGSIAAIQAYKARNGFFKFQRFAELDRASLATATPLGAEQSNSAFYVKGKSFFKMFRRLQAGIHPEQEILSQLNATHFDGVPQLLGFIEYQDYTASYAIGILENHIEDATSAWDLMVRTPSEKTQSGCQNFFADAALELGRTTAQMHKALKDLDGTPVQPEEVPFDKLMALLQANGKQDLVARVETIAKSATDIDSIAPVGRSRMTDTAKVLVPQRIHGDYHLGQLLYKDGKFIVLDFEGEPTRTLEYRRRLRSPAADIAGMLRSFAYASAVRQNNATEKCRGGKEFEQFTAEAFLQGYSRESGISVAQLKEEASPYVLGKAIYEACYELEYRPDWFWIPEAALKSGL